MSEQEVKQIRNERLIADGVKGSILALIVWILWQEKQESDSYILRKMEKLEAQISDCQTEKKNRIEQGIDYIINKLNNENSR